MLYVNMFAIVCVCVCVCVRIYDTRTYVWGAGLVDKCRDVLYVNMFAMAGSLLSDNFWWFLILIPLYGLSSLSFFSFFLFVFFLFFTHAGSLQSDT
jgi:hypothetical protein